MGRIADRASTSVQAIAQAEREGVLSAPRAGENLIAGALDNRS